MKKTTMKRMRTLHRQEFTKIEVEVIQQTEDTYVEVKRRVKKSNYVSFKLWLRKQKVEKPCPKIEQILMSSPQ